MIDLSDFRSGLVIVAHPDDETIWCGGLILAHPDWDWTVISLCRADDPDRRPKFMQACQRLNAMGRISDLDDGNPLADIMPQREIGRRLAQWTENGEWDLILTHGWNGEYGHERHMETHLVVAEMVRRDDLWCRELWTFAYTDGNGAACTPLADADIEIPLSRDLLATKQDIVRTTYGYGPDSFEVRSCCSPETFTRLRL